MKMVEILSLPKIEFAHTYKTEQYSNRFYVAKRFIEVTYVAEGSLNIEIDNQNFCANEGDVICLLHDKETLISATEFHCHHTVGSSAQWSFLNDEINGLYLPVITFEKSDTADIRNMIDDFIYKQNLYKSSRTKGAAKFLELLCEIDKCNRKIQKEKMPGELMYTQRVKEYIQKNIHSPITQTNVAEFLGISPGYLCSVFKKTQGITLMKYVNKVKLENIKALMDNENVHLYEASALYGYTDPNYVSRLFKQFFGYNITDKMYTYNDMQE